ncbi:DinI family protein [Reichenbachiella agarivorans]|uniref:DinI family protein n=1 Tax=Reichenbachiella agarivorans TaxID=2979464 RepID=A0ABY6CM73_9BACT|nr:DinI family protein [Reichenbachiella agarivorans]UXP30593.1 DinI family protein [Reichenbachiella agarivorans]
MNLPALELEIAKRIHTMNSDQQVDIMQYINQLSASTASKETTYRKRAITEIRKALKSL